MAQKASNPEILSPEARLSSMQYRTYSPSPTRSTKRNLALERDPLLANLSPQATLNAIAEANTLSPSQLKSANALVKSVGDASASERALGVRAAQAGKQLGEWCEEMQSWVWPGHGFALPATGKELWQGFAWAERYRTTSSSDQEKEHGVEGEYWGSLPARVVLDLERRIEAIRDDLQALGVDELKDHIRLGLNSPKSKFGSGLEYQSPYGITSEHAKLDDFTALLTATLMSALPFIFRLESLLDCWSTRLILLRRIPSWLMAMNDTESSLDLGWQSIGRRADSEPWADSDLTRDAYRIMKAVLEDRVVDSGQKTDAMLDLLEGGDDVLPDEWVDRMDAAEESYRQWLVEAERVVRQNESAAEKITDQAEWHIDNGQRLPETTSQTGKPVDDQSSHTEGAESTQPLSLDGQDRSSASDDTSSHDRDHFNKHKPRKLDLQPCVYSESRTPSDMSPPDSATSGAFNSYMSSPELSTASRVEYIKSSPNVSLPSEPPTDLDTMSRQSSQRTAREERPTNDNEASSATMSSSPRPRTLSFNPKPTINENDSSIDPNTSESGLEPPSPATANASRHSLEVVQPGSVRWIF